jgi:hypothetical protein
MLDLRVMICEWTKDVVEHFPASFIDAIKPIIVPLTRNSSCMPRQLIHDFSITALSHTLFVLQAQKVWANYFETATLYKEIQWYLGIRPLWNTSKLGIRPVLAPKTLPGIRPLFGIRLAC